MGSADYAGLADIRQTKEYLIKERVLYKIHIIHTVILPAEDHSDKTFSEKNFELRPSNGIYMTPLSYAIEGEIFQLFVSRV